MIDFGCGLTTSPPRLPSPFLSGSEAVISFNNSPANLLAQNSRERKPKPRLGQNPDRCRRNQILPLAVPGSEFADNVDCLSEAAYCCVHLLKFSDCHLCFHPERDTTVARMEARQLKEIEAGGRGAKQL